MVVHDLHNGVLHPLTGVPLHLHVESIPELGGTALDYQHGPLVQGIEVGLVQLDVRADEHEVLPVGAGDGGVHELALEPLHHHCPLGLTYIEVLHIDRPLATVFDLVGPQVQAIAGHVRHRDVHHAHIHHDHVGRAEEVGACMGLDAVVYCSVDGNLLEVHVELEPVESVDHRIDGGPMGIGDVHILDLERVGCCNAGPAVHDHESDTTGVVDHAIGDDQGRTAHHLVEHHVDSVATQALEGATIDVPHDPVGPVVPGGGRDASPVAVQEVAVPDGDIDREFGPLDPMVDPHVIAAREVAVLDQEVIEVLAVTVVVDVEALGLVLEHAVLDEIRASLRVGASMLDVEADVVVVGERAVGDLGVPG